MKKIIQYYHPALRRKTEKVLIDKETKELIIEMKEVLKKEGGVGLAAPQIGISKRLIVIDTGKEIFALLNPEITWQGKEKITTKEGCLSVKGVWLDVIRTNKIKVSALTENGKSIEIEAKEIMAVVLQHEIDHLNGILFIDRVSFFLKMKSLFIYFLNKTFKH